MSPVSGTSYGGDTLEITGSNLGRDGDGGKYLPVVKVGGVLCSSVRLLSADAGGSKVSCITGKGSGDSPVSIASNGEEAQSDLKFQYEGSFCVVV